MEVLDLYETAKVSQWNATRDIPWDRDEPMTATEREVLRGLLSNYHFGEMAGIEIPAFALLKVKDREAKLFLSTQQMDEARHVEAFDMRLQQIGCDVKRVQMGNVAFSKALADLLTLETADEAIAGIHIVFENLGSVAFRSHYRALCKTGRDPVTREILKRVIADETRHEQFGRTWMKKFLEANPERIEVVDRVQKRIAPMMIETLLHKSAKMKVWEIEREEDVASAVKKFTWILDDLGLDSSYLN